MIKTVKLFGLDVAAMNMEETVTFIDEKIKNNITMQHVVINASKTVLMEKDKNLKKIIKQCKLINADGQSIVWASKILKKPLPERVAGIDLMFELISLAEEKEYGVYFFGATSDVVKKTVNIFKEKHPKLIVSGYRNGYFTKNDENEIIEDMRKSGAKILLVAFSSPKKEYWLCEHIAKLNIPFCMGVGGSFDVVAGKTKRAPKWMQKNGLEWFYRFVQEPRRMWKRYILGNLSFVSLVIKEKYNF
ncbi:WecB/TagA/CpsF family glycosyltransferase [Paraclostridium bifermentans]|uniref:WecB/TagA/CpsF family glycosyltransferase n=1 Tax=Paraclostridium bifermentans TaxID=1490 RepID=UPI002911E265|nr:WecB/TagA/CpsF family glycosyltransferase [Paraclostridium bifermentans]MDU3335633.1 WecB/TagA/CpsF family glycosyltransferase [Paraclostridium bifermentans]